MGVIERRLREKEDLRRKILDAAQELFVKEGYENVSMRKIADKIEYSPTAIYLHFKNKSELFHCLCDEYFAHLVTRLEGIRRRSKDPLDFARQGMRAYVEFGLANPNPYRVMFMIEGDHDLECYQKSMGERAFNYLRDGVIACMKAGLIRRVDPDLTSQALWAGLHGITSLLITHEQFPWADRDRLIDTTIGMMMQSLKK
jgi:AcrR family transcriptional regulator